MSLFRKWARPIHLPETPERRLAAGKNAVTQTAFAGAVVAAEFYESQHPGHDLLKTRLSAPFDEMLIRFPKARHVDSPLPVLTAVDKDDYNESPNGTQPQQETSAGRVEPLS